MSTVDRVKMISTGSFSPGCGITVAGWDLPLTDDLTFFLGQRFIDNRAGLAALAVLRLWDASATCCLELLEVLLMAVLEHVVMLSQADALLLLQSSLPSDGSLEPSWKCPQGKLTQIKNTDEEL